jgi:hypothetical protein
VRASPYGVAILLAVCCSARPYAQNRKPDLPLVEWSNGRKLAIKDFGGNIPSRATEASLSWVAIDATWECQEGKGSSQVRAVFDPNRSWWREATRNLWQSVDSASLLATRDDGERSLLAHEQLHFDMTEVWARRIREKFKTLPAFCKTPDGPGEFEKAIGDMEREWEEEQQQYDKETSHGTDAVRQRVWARKVAKTLQQSYSAPAR